MLPRFVWCKTFPKTVCLVGQLLHLGKVSWINWSSTSFCLLLVYWQPRKTHSLMVCLKMCGIRCLFSACLDEKFRLGLGLLFCFEDSYDNCLKPFLNFLRKSPALWGITWMGECLQAGSPAGNCWWKVSNHPLFLRDNADLAFPLHVTVLQA